MKTPIYALMLAALLSLGLFGTAMASPEEGDRMVLAAAPGGPDDERMGGGPMDKERMEEMRKRIETMRAWKLKDELKLDEKTSAKVSAIMGRYDEKRMTLREGEKKTMQELKEILKSEKADENRLKPLIAQVEKNREEHSKILSEEFKELKGVLTVEQQARLLLFIPKFQHEIREMMKGGKDHDGPRGQRPPKEDRW